MPRCFTDQSPCSSFPVAGQILSLKNISTDMSGYYICTSSNEVGTESCNITVAIRLRKSGLGAGWVSLGLTEARRSLVWGPERPLRETRWR